MENPQENCTYQIHSVEKVQSKTFFRINSSSGSVTILQSLENSFNEKHRLIINYFCPISANMISTRLHINILDNKRLMDQRENFYRFSQEKYLIVLESSLRRFEKKYLMNFELINNQEQRIKSDVQILEGEFYFQKIFIIKIFLFR